MNIDKSYKIKYTLKNVRVKMRGIESVYHFQTRLGEEIGQRKFDRQKAEG